MTSIKVLSPLRAMRAGCLDCAAGDRKFIIWCSCDGVHSTRCQQWPYRFGQRPETIRQRFGTGLVTPAMMPEANVNLDALPGSMAAAAEYLAGRGGKSKSKAG